MQVQSHKNCDGSIIFPISCLRRHLFGPLLPPGVWVDPKGTLYILCHLQSPGSWNWILQPGKVTYQYLEDCFGSQDEVASKDSLSGDGVWTTEFMLFLVHSLNKSLPQMFLLHNLHTACVTLSACVLFPGEFLPVRNLFVHNYTRLLICGQGHWLFLFVDGVS